MANESNKILKSFWSGYELNIFSLEALKNHANTS